MEKEYIMDTGCFSWLWSDQRDAWAIGRIVILIILGFLATSTALTISPTNVLAAPLLQSPNIKVEKATNALGQASQDADAVPGPYIGAGTGVVWTYVVSNTGDVPLANVNLVDDQEGAITDLISGDINNDSILDIDETWLLLKQGIAQTGQYTNYVQVESIAVDGTSSPLLDGVGQPLPPITDDDISHYFGAEPSLTFQTAINGYRPTTPPGPYLTMGEVVTWTYTITNSGNVPFEPIDVSGHYTGNPTADPFGTMVPVIFGDNNNDAILDVGETWTYVLNRTIGYDQYIAVTSLYADPVDNLGNPIPSLGNQTLTTDDILYYVGTRPSLQLAMRPNRQNADVAPGPAILADEAIVWTYVVANDGTAPLANIMLIDGTLGSIGNQIGGDSNGNGLLDMGEFWTYEMGDSATAGQQTQSVEVSAEPVAPNGDPLLGLDGLPMPSVTTTTTAFYYGAIVKLEFDKQLDPQYADIAGSGPFILAGNSFEWTYAITNSGNVPLENIQLADDSLFNNGSTTPVNPTTLSISGDDNDNNLLDPSEVWTWVQEENAKPNQQTNRATVTANPISVEGSPVLLADNSEIAPISAEDSNLYFGAAPAVEMIKTANGVVADTAPGLYLPTGDTLSWGYTLTNIGNVPLSTVNFSNSATGAVGPPSSGDLNNNGLFDVGETWLYETTGAANSGPIAILSTFTAQPVDSTGNAIPPVSAAINQSETQYYFGVETQIALESQANGEDADSGEGLIIEMGETLRWTYRVYNNSNVTLIDIEVTDNALAGAGNNATLFCPQTVLLAGEQMECTAETLAMAGAQEHIATVIGTPADGQDNSLVEIAPDSFFARQASDPTRYFGAEIGIDLEKATNGVDADSPSGPYIAVGSTVAWTYRVANPGNWPLTDVVLTDQIDSQTQITPEPVLDAGYNVGDLNSDGLLDAAETWLYNATATARLGTQASTATVTANALSTSGLSQTVTDSDMSHYLGSQPGIEVKKYTNRQDGGEAPGVYVPVGDTVLWSYEVYNRGNSSVADIVLTDAILQDGQEIPIVTAPVIGDEPTFNIGDSNLNRQIDNDEVWRYTASAIPAQSGAHETVATVTGIPVDQAGNPLSTEPLRSSDPSHYFGAASALTLRYFAGDVDDEDTYLAAAEETVLYTFVVENWGNMSLKNLVLTDDNGTPDDPTDDLLVQESQCSELAGPLAPGRIVQCQLQKNVPINLSEQVSVATVKGTPVDQDNQAVANLPRPTAQDNAEIALIASELIVEYTVYTGHDDGTNCPGTDQLFSINVDQITYCYQATNRGNTYLDQLRLLDDQGALITNHNQLLAPDQSFDFFTEEIIDLAISNPVISRTVTAIGVPSRANSVSIGNGPITATDRVQIYQEAVHVGGIVWYDDDGDGLQNEIVADATPNGGVPGVTTYLIDALTGDAILDSAGEPLQQATDENGHYLFDDLSPGNYVVRFDLTTLPDGYKPTLSYKEDINSQSLVDSESGYAATTGLLFGGEENLSIHLGLIKGVQVGGLVWVDKNQDGIQNGSEIEPGIADIDVTLLNKMTGLPLFTDEGTAMTTVTDSEGHYLFDALPTGSYAVRLSSESISVAYLYDSLERVATSKLSGSQAELGLDFGLIETVEVSGIVWYDNDGDGVQDEIIKEQGVLNVLVTLLNGDTETAVLDEEGKPLSARTDIDGLYRFAHLPPGRYATLFDLDTLPSGFMPTQPDVNEGNSASDESDSDAEPFTGKTAAAILPNNGVTILALDLGITRNAAVQVGGQVWFDPDRDGQRVPLSAEEQAQAPNVANITVTLLDSETMEPLLDEHGLWQTQQTDDEGTYLFTGLSVGSYAVQFVLEQLPAGYGPTVQNRGNNSSDSDVDPETGDTTSTGSIPAGEQHITLDLGIIRVQPEDEPSDDTSSGEGSDNNNDSGNPSDSDDEGSGDDSIETPKDNTGEDEQSGTPEDNNVSRPATIGDTVWFDLDRDGILDEDESGIEDFTIHLYNEDDVLIRTTKTGAGGFYLFTNVTPGTYRLQCVQQLGYHISPQNVGSNEMWDSDVDPADCRTPWITLASGDYETGWDIGLYTLERSGSIRNQVWFDTNQNGRHDGKESGISGILVDLYNIRNELLWTQRTNATGEYRFYDLEHGAYYLEFTAAPEYIAAQASSASNDRKIRTPLISLNEAMDEAIGATTGYHLGGLEPVSLESQVWHDLNEDGVKDQDEPGLSGVLVLLYDENERVSATTLTDQEGYYRFQGLVPKKYTLEFVPPAGFTFSSIDSSVGKPELNTDDFALRTTEITLDSESSLVMLEAGFTSSPTALPMGEEANFVGELFLPIIYKP